MKIYTKIRIDIETGDTIEEEFFEYDGPLALCDIESDMMDDEEDEYSMEDFGPLSDEPDEGTGEVDYFDPALAKYMLDHPKQYPDIPGLDKNLNQSKLIKAGKILGKIPSLTAQGIGLLARKIGKGQVTRDMAIQESIKQGYTKEQATAIIDNWSDEMDTMINIGDNENYKRLLGTTGGGYGEWWKDFFNPQDVERFRIGPQNSTWLRGKDGKQYLIDKYMLSPNYGGPIPIAGSPTPTLPGDAGDPRKAIGGSDTNTDDTGLPGYLTEIIEDLDRPQTMTENQSEQDTAGAGGVDTDTGTTDGRVVPKSWLTYRDNPTPQNAENAMLDIFMQIYENPNLQPDKVMGDFESIIGETKGRLDESYKGIGDLREHHTTKMDEISGMRGPTISFGGQPVKTASGGLLEVRPKKTMETLAGIEGQRLEGGLLGYQGQNKAALSKLGTQGALVDTAVNPLLDLWKTLYKGRMGYKTAELGQEKDMEWWEKLLPLAGEVAPSLPWDKWLT